ncbi:MAG: DUF4236 domain-containing protein [Calditrichaeota bacterium]|nr:MAG: DUF4236 domain-containing protein [Calditrichota bacterium]
MNLHYYRWIPLIPPWLHLNLSTRGWSVTVGVPGLRFTFGPGRRSISTRAPGTGISWRKRF